MFIARALSPVSSLQRHSGVVEGGEAGGIAWYKVHKGSQSHK